MSLTVLATFWFVSFLFAITPGVDWAYAISAGIRGRMVMPAVAGMLHGHLAAAILVAVGVGALVAKMPFALTLLTVAGASYLLWLGVGLIRHPAARSTGQDDTPASARQWFVKGFGVSSLIPKVLLLFLALLPQFFDSTSTWPMSLQMLTLGAVHIGTSGMVYLLVGYGSQIVLNARPSAANLMSQASGVMMTAVAVLLLAEPIMQRV